MSLTHTNMVYPTTKPTKSFWIEGAGSPLRDLRSSADLPKETDVVIIGSGYTGAASAYWLHKVRFSLYYADIDVSRWCHSFYADARSA